MSSVTFRPAKQTDWAGIEHLLLSNKLPLDGAKDHLVGFFVAQDESGLIGCGGVESRGDTALLRSVAVIPSRQGEGIGRQIVSLILTQAQTKGVKTIGLLTTSARQWFFTFGFELADQRHAPSALKRSAEFQGACPVGSDFMMLDLSSWRFFKSAVSSESSGSLNK